MTLDRRRRLQRASAAQGVVRRRPGRHARRAQAAFDPHRSARSGAHVHRHVERRRVRVARRRRATGGRSTAASRPTSCPTPTPSTATTRIACGCPPVLPDRLYQQNHCGIFRLDRPDTRWTDIGVGMPKSVGPIGFPMVLHPRDPDTLWVFPMDGSSVWPRVSPGGKPAVYRSVNGGTHLAPAGDRPAGRAGLVDRQAPGNDRGLGSRKWAFTSARRAARCGAAATKANRGAASPRICRTSTRSRSPDGRLRPSAARRHPR